MKDQQLTLNFKAGLSDCYSSCREYTQSLVHNQGRPVKNIAADMDFSPSQLGRKLAQSPGDSARFTLDDLENFMQVTGDTSPIKYLIDKYLANATCKKIEDMERELALLKQNQKIRAA
jgi:hypothetical protein